MGYQDDLGMAPALGNVGNNSLLPFCWGLIFQPGCEAGRENGEAPGGEGSGQGKPSP